MKISQLKEIINNLVKETLIVPTYDGTDKNLTSAQKSDIDKKVKDGESVRIIKQSNGIQEDMAAPSVATYTLKPNAESILNTFIEKEKKPVTKDIVRTIYNIIKEEGPQFASSLLTKVKDRLRDKYPDIDEVLKVQQKIRYYLWGKQLQTDNLAEVPNTPFIRSKAEVERTGFQKQQDLQVSDPKQFMANQQSLRHRPQSSNDKIITYKDLRTTYFSLSRTDPDKADRIKYTMEAMIDNDIALNLLYQWDNNYLQKDLDPALRDFAKENGYLEGRSTSDIFQRELNKALKDGTIKPINNRTKVTPEPIKRKPEAPSATEKPEDIISKLTPEMEDDFYRSIGMENPKEIDKKIKNMKTGLSIEDLLDDEEY